MADIAIKMGVNGPDDDVDGVMSIFNYIYRQPEETDEVDFVFEAFEDDFSDGAVGVLASMTFILNYLNATGEKKQFISHVLRSFERIQVEDKNAVRIIIPSKSRKLLRMIFMQRDVEGNDEERGQFIQQMAEKYGFCK
ncbi:MAG: hypothetical protein IKP92_08850 [Lachnospiraceae bacterium]|nr:hypothetical protein [Lachnospiraceae bacterium]